MSMHPADCPYIHRKNAYGQIVQCTGPSRPYTLADVEAMREAWNGKKAAEARSAAVEAAIFGTAKDENAAVRKPDKPSFTVSDDGKWVVFEGQVTFPPVNDGIGEVFPNYYLAVAPPSMTIKTWLPPDPPATTSPADPAGRFRNLELSEDDDE